MNNFYLTLHADQDSYDYINHKYVQFYLMKNEGNYKVIHEDSQKAKRFSFTPIPDTQRLDIEVKYIKEEIIPYVSRYITRFRNLGK